MPLQPPAIITNSLPSCLWELRILLAFVFPCDSCPLRVLFLCKGQGSCHKLTWPSLQECAEEDRKLLYKVRGKGSNRPPLLFPKAVGRSSEGEKLGYRTEDMLIFCPCCLLLGENSSLSTSEGSEKKWKAHL